MENNQPQKLDKKFFIKGTLINIVGTVAGSLFLVFIAYGGRIPVKSRLIVMGIFIVFISIIAIFAFKYPPSKTHMTTSKFRKAFLILGILIIIVNLALVLVEGGNINYYMGVGLGLLIIYYSRTYKKKEKLTF